MAALNPPAPAAVPSPCIAVCRMDAATGWCEGCLRTLDEIAEGALFLFAAPGEFAYRPLEDGGDVDAEGGVGDVVGVELRIAAAGDAKACGDRRARSPIAAGRWEDERDEVVAAVAAVVGGLRGGDRRGPASGLPLPVSGGVRAATGSERANRFR